MTGICDWHLSLVDACHIMGMVHLYKHWTLVPFTLTVKGSTIVCLFIMSDFLSFSHGLFILDKQRNDLCVDRQYHLLCHVAKYVSHGNVITMTRQTFGKCAPCTNVCQINLLWKKYNTFSLGWLHKPTLLVRLPNTPVTGTWLNIVKCHVMSIKQYFTVSCCVMSQACNVVEYHVMLQDRHVMLLHSVRSSVLKVCLLSSCDAPECV